MAKVWSRGRRGRSEGSAGERRAPAFVELGERVGECSSGGVAVLADEPAETVDPLDSVEDARLVDDRSAIGDLEVDAPVGPSLVVMLDVDSQHGLEVDVLAEVRLSLRRRPPPPRGPPGMP